jgi:hypothetical protein
MLCCGVRYVVRAGFHVAVTSWSDRVAADMATLVRARLTSAGGCWLLRMLHARAWWMPAVSSMHRCADTPFLWLPARNAAVAQVTQHGVNSFKFFMAYKGALMARQHGRPRR